MGNEVFTHNKTFQDGNSESVSINLESGLYCLKCMDTYGDGGMSAVITDVKENNLLLKINWNNLQWNQKDGYLKYYKFRV